MYINLSLRNTLSLTLQVPSDEYRLIDTEKPLSEPVIFQKRERDLEYSLYHHPRGFYILTNQDHKNFSIKFCNANQTEKSNWKTVIEGSNDTLIEGIDLFNSHMVISERSNGLVNLKVVDLDSLKTHLIPFNEPTYVVQTTKYRVRFQKTSLFLHIHD